MKTGITYFYRIIIIIDDAYANEVVFEDLFTSCFTSVTLVDSIV